MKYCLLLIFYCIFAFKGLLYAGQTKFDTLWSAIDTIQDDARRVNTLIQISEQFIRNDLKTASKYAEGALKLSKTLGNEDLLFRAYNQKARVARAHENLNVALQLYDSALMFCQLTTEQSECGKILNYMGILEMNLQNYDSARSYYFKALDIFTLTGDSVRMANELSNIGITYEMQGLYSTSLEYYFKCLEIDEKLRDTAGIASDYMSIAIIFKKLNDFESAIKYYQESLFISEKSGDKNSIASVLTNLGMIFKDQQKYDLALQTQQRALSVFEGLDHKRGLMTAWHNIAEIYFGMGDLEEATNYLDKSTSMAETEGNNYVLLANDVLLSKIFFAQGKYQKALSTLNPLTDQAQRMKLLPELLEIVSLMSKIYESAGQPEKALEALHQSIVLKDSIFTRDKSSQMLEMQTKYETAQKESQIQLLNKEKALIESEIKRKILERNFILGSIFLFGLFGIILIRSFTLRQKQKRLLLNKQLEMERTEALRLQELDEAKSRFFANIAHEFKTPLTLILGPADQIQENTNGQNTREMAQMIKTNAGKLLTLTNQLLELSKLESGMIHLQPEKSDMAAFLKSSVHAFESMAEVKDISLNVEVNSGTIIMDFDPEKMGVIISNLISNAIKFTPPNGEITVKLSLKDDEAMLVVQDTGIGIDSAHLPFIFNRFYQVDDSYTRKTQGTGIGLALVKELVELHQGKINVESKPGDGTVFTILLPVSQPDEVQSDISSNTNTYIFGTEELFKEGELVSEERTFGSGSSIHVNHPDTVLVVEDNPDVRRFIVETLSNKYNIIEAENGKDGLAKTLENIPDLIVSDLMMPEMDGYEFCGHVKNDDRTSHIPVILLTARDSMDNRVEGLETGADDYLTKPFNAKELIVRIRNLIQLRKNLQDKFSKSGSLEVFPEKENAFISKLKEIIESNLDREDFNMDELGKALAMSRTQVHRKLKALTNMSTSQFIRKYKLDRAVELLKTGAYNVSEVAYMLGFNTPNYFSACFSEQFGFTPSELVKSGKN